MKTNGVSFAKSIDKLFSCLSLTAVCLMAASPAAYAAIAGHVQFVSGDVQIANPAGQARSAQKGDAINEGDMLTSAPKSSAQIKMQDGGFIAIRPDSQMKFDQFVFAGKEDGSEKSFFSVFKGGFRAITGAIGQVNKHNYRITTPTASIGIRGSDHETLVVIPGSPLAQLAPTGSYSKVNVGGTSMTTNEGTLNVGPNQMGFAGSLNQSPQLQPLNTNIFTVAPAPVITPGVNAGETETEQQAAAQETSTDSATQDETPPIREVAVVDTTAPRTGGAPAANAPPMTTTTVAEVVEPPAPTTVMPTTTVAGLDVNLTTGTATTNTGQVIPVTQSLAATQAQAAADAAANAATGAQTSAATAQTADTQLAALAPVDTAPAATAIATADPLVVNAATSYSAISTLTPVATATAATAVTDAATNVEAATMAVTTANALAPVATTAATTAIGTADSNIGTATPVVTTAGTLTPANATLAADNAAAAATTAGTASSQTTTAANQLAANAAFADATAAPALAAAQAANTTLQSANTAVQGAVTPISTNNASLTAAQLAAQNALTAAQSNLDAANTSLYTATTQNTALTAAQLAAQNALATAQTNLDAANTNLNTATTQNMALTAAQLAALNALTTAQANLTAANTNLATATAQNNTIATAQTSAPAQLTAAQTAAAAAQTAALAAQTAATQAATLQAAGDLVGAQAQLLIAQQQLVIAQTQQAAAASAQTALTTSLTSAQTAQTTGLTSVTNALAAANTAQTAASTASTQSALVQPAATAAGTAIAAVIPAANIATADAGTASTQAANAQTARTIASTAIADATTAANTAATDATAAQTQAAAAQTASTNADTALTTSNNNLATVNTQAPIIASNAPIAAYNNPAVVGNFIAAAMFPVATTGGFNEALTPANPLRLNTTYVLDIDGNLVEARNLPFQVQANQNGNVLTPSITAATGADIKWSGGTATDTFKLADNSLYAGRWIDATVTVTDNAVPTNVYTYTPAASLWAVILPPPAGYVPSLVGTTTYDLAGNTTPVDAIGNPGTLNSASLTANFTSQLVNAAVNLTMNTGTMAGTFNVSASNMPIDANGGFGVPNASALTTSCGTGTGTCAAGATGYSADLGGSFAGTGAASIGLSYNIWPTTALSTDAAINSILGLVAFTATAPTTGTNPPAGSNYGIDFMNPVTIAGGYNTGLHNNTLPMANTSIRLDGAGNLVKLLGTTYQEPGGSPYATTQLPPIVSLANANIAWSGGTAADYHQSLSGAVTFGRWEGGIVAVTDLSTTTPASFTTSLTGGTYGPTSSLWAYATGPANGFVQSLTGTTSYTKTAHTAPFDSQGGMGVLNSASLSANFTSQLVNAALNLTMNTGQLAGDTFDVAGDMQINALATHNSNAFKSASPPTLTCTGPCILTTGESFLAEMSGAFVGATAVDAVLGYAIWLETSTSPADIVYGYVAFNTGVAPTVNPTGPLAAYVATNTAVAYTGAYGGSFNFIAAPGEITPVGNPTTFTQNFSGGFRRDILNGATTGTPPTTATPPTTTTNGITFGVWENVTSVSSSDQMPIMPNQSASMRTLPSYMYGAEGYLDSPVAYFNGTTGNTGPLAGAFSYNQVAATSYDSGSWAAGTVNATMSANFTTQTVTMGLSGRMGADDWTLDSTNRPITFMNSTTGTGARFSDSAPVITVNASACATNCGGNISGAFLGQNYAGALVQYSLWDNNNLNLGGLIGFENATPVTSGTGPSPGTFVVANSWLIESPTAITTNPTTGVLTGWSGSNWNSVVAPAANSVAYTSVGTGSGIINWGLWGSGSINTNTFSYVPGFAQLHWITAPEPTPVYLAQVLTTTNAVYNFVDGDVTNMFSVSGGGHGTINGTTSLTANFATQTVAANLNLTVGGNTWAASTSNAPLEYSNGNILNAFSADSYRSPSQPGYLTVIVNPGTGQIVAGGSLNGQLVGAALDGAILKFNLVGVPAASTEWVQGVAALGAAAANDTATSYRVVLSSISEPMALVPTVMLGGAYNNAARVSTDINGHLTQFDDNSGGGSSTIQHVSGGYADQGSFTVGSDTVSWGRWTAGTVVNVQDRTSEVWQNNITLAGGAHAVVGPIATGPVSLPTSGTYTYNQVGGTSPTDQAGVAGTLNSATLSANFTAQTVDVGVNVTAGGATLNAAATSVPIMNRANFFTDSKMTGAGALAVTCTAGLCGTTNGGGIGGGFGGTGGVVAAITYGFEKGGLNAGTVNGVAVFQQGAAPTVQ